MIIDLTRIADVLALVGCALLLILWVLCSRRLLGFLLTCTGWALLIACIKSGGDLRLLEQWCVGIVCVATVVLITYGLIVARKRRMPVYVPIDQRRKQ